MHCFKYRENYFKIEFVHGGKSVNIPAGWWMKTIVASSLLLGGFWFVCNIAPGDAYTDHLDGGASPSRSATTDPFIRIESRLAILASPWSPSLSSSAWRPKSSWRKLGGPKHLPCQDGHASGTQGHSRQMDMDPFKTLLGIVPGKARNRLSIICEKWMTDEITAARVFCHKPGMSSHWLRLQRRRQGLQN